MFNHFNKDGPLYIIQSKTDKKLKFQLHINISQYKNTLSYQLKNNTDKDTTITFIENCFNNDIELTNWFSQIMPTNIYVKLLPIDQIDIDGIVIFSNKNKTCFKLTQNNISFVNKNILPASSELLITELIFGNKFNRYIGNSLDKLTNLQSLTFGDSFNRYLGISSLNKLTNLQSLTFGSNFDEELYNSLDKLTNLKYLTFGKNFNKKLGNSLDKLTNLQSLTFGYSFNEELGNSLDKLINLQSLTFGKKFNKKLGNSLDKLTNLQNLYK